MSRDWKAERGVLIREERKTRGQQRRLCIGRGGRPRIGRRRCVYRASRGWQLE